MKFRLKVGVGAHIGVVERDAEGNELPPTKYVSGDVVESHKDLAVLWPEKWELVHDSSVASGYIGNKPKEIVNTPVAQASTAPNVTGPVLPAVPAAAIAPAPPVQQVNDVTTSFPVAVKHNLQVWGNETSGYAFRELDVPNATAINKTPLDRPSMEAELIKYTGETV